MKINISKKLLAIFAAGTIGMTACTIKESTPIKVNSEIVLDELEEVEPNEVTYIMALKDKTVRLEKDNKSKQIGFVPENTIIKVVNDCDNFVEVSINGIKGYIDKTNTKEIIKNKDIAYKKIVFMKEKTQVYKDNNTKTIIGELPKYETAFVYDEDETYYNVSSNGIGGFIEKEKTEELPSEVIIVDIGDQTVDLYDDNILVNNYKVITGTPTPTRETRIGYFQIYDNRSNRNLINEDGSYGVWVDVMMKFDEGRGFHDCTYQTDYNENGAIIRQHGWRDEKVFDEVGRYKYDGSHGCVNMINKDAKELYNNVELGTKVLVKR